MKKKMGKKCTRKKSKIIKVNSCPVCLSQSQRTQMKILTSTFSPCLWEWLNGQDLRPGHFILVCGTSAGRLQEYLPDGAEFYFWDDYQLFELFWATWLAIFVMEAWWAEWHAFYYFTLEMAAQSLQLFLEFCRCKQNRKSCPLLR